MEYHERPGVYSSYEMTSVLASGNGGSMVGLAATCSLTDIETVTSVSRAESLLAEDQVALDLVRLLLAGGAGGVMIAPASEDTVAGYKAAAEALLAEKKIRFLVCDRDYGDYELGLKTVVAQRAQEGNECILVVGMGSVSTEALITRAATFNCERVVLTGGTAKLGRDTSVSGAIYGAAAMAGLLAAQTDPAMPVHGTALKGLGGISQKFTEAELDSLIRGGVTPLEAVGGIVSAVRAVTSRTTTAGAADASWREITTIMIVDDVVPGVRDALRARFLRKKNNAVTRGAIGSQVVMELEQRKKNEIIDSYGDISVETDETDPTVCLVRFTFAVAHGVSRIYLTAHITV